MAGLMAGGAQLPACLNAMMGARMQVGAMGKAYWQGRMFCGFSDGHATGTTCWLAPPVRGAMFISFTRALLPAITCTHATARRSTWCVSLAWRARPTRTSRTRQPCPRAGRCWGTSWGRRAHAACSRPVPRASSRLCLSVSRACQYRCPRPAVWMPRRYRCPSAPEACCMSV